MTMQEDAKQTEALSAEIQDVMRNLVSAIRAVKLYPPNNPVYSQSVRKSFESLAHFLDSAPRYVVGVQKTYFLFEQTPVAKETQLNRTIAQDIFGKGLREIVFLQGLTEAELLGFFSILALSPEEQALKSGIVSLLWEQGAAHIRVTEASLEEVITTQPDKGKLGGKEAPVVKLGPEIAKKEFVLAGRTLVAGDLNDDPAKFGAAMLEIARQSLGESETIEDRLHALYREAGRQMQAEHPEQSEALFQGLARSVLAMDPEHRDKFIASKLYAEMDADQIREQGEGAEGAEGADEAPGSPPSPARLPEELHEVVTGRFSKQWTVHQIAELLRKTTAKKAAPPAPAVDPSQVEAIPIPEEMHSLVKDLAEYSPDEMETLKTISEVGQEADITEAAVRTLIFLLPQVKGPGQTATSEKTRGYFSNIVRQLEENLTFLLKSKEYDLATIIVRAYHLPVDPALRPRFLDAIRKASSRDVINTVVTDLRLNPRGSPAYLAAYGYLSVLDREATTTLLEILAVEKDRAVRRYLIDILKELGKSQIALIGQRLSDSRWYVVRNIVSILSESKTDETIALLEKVVDHKQVQIRHEVIKGLLSIGGKKAAALLTRFVKDKDIDVRLAGVRALAVVHGAGRSEAQALTAVLEGRRINKKENELTIEVIKTLEKIGDLETAEYLKRYARIRWWRSRRPQEELRAVAVAAIEAIGRRHGHAG